MNTQDANLEPVPVNNAKFATAAEAVLAFVLFRTRQPQGPDQAFTADQLRFYVNNNLAKGVSPGTSDRILRNLRGQSKLNYIVMNRANSLYRAVPVVVKNNPVTSGRVLGVDASDNG